MDIINLLISLISGAVGGNVAGSAMPAKNPGTLINTIAGLIGGGLGDFILKASGLITSATSGGTGELDLASIISTIAASGVGGGALTAILAVVKDMMEKKTPPTT
jgi:uncharacterized membrane protein YeaQ/YmgE (transglycosylase-associated protein family)